MISRSKLTPNKVKASTPAELLKLAEMLYVSHDLKHAPKWAQLGETTRSVWIGYVQAGQLTTT